MEWWLPDFFAFTSILTCQGFDFAKEPIGEQAHGAVTYGAVEPRPVIFQGACR